LSTAAHPTALVSGLVYLEIDATSVDQWRVFGGEVLGMSSRDGDDGSLLLAMDRRTWRIRVHPSDRDGISAIGWQARGADDLTAMRARLDAAGMAVTELTAAECASRAVASGLSFTDAIGLTHDVVVDTEEAWVTEAGEPLPFVTGELGMGHIVFYIDDLPAADALYLDVFGMSLRESIPTQVGGGGHFYGCNPRHHAVAVVDAGHRPAVMHVMVELADIDDVGTAMDRARRLGWEPRTDLGRHRTDHMLSFYVPGPGGFDFEVGTGGLWVDDAVWEATKASSRRRAWGHGGIESQDED
jgi:3,4-dihydroxy-9,10-secoandrosta-1,3,5(10)-triene-9,17-dione 4,5-dioxygenase